MDHLRGTPARREFWDDFYSEGGPGCVPNYEWYLLYEDIRPFLLLHLREGQRVLHIGCGNSLLGEQMVSDADLPVVSVVNIDNCELVIEKMREHHQTHKKQSRAAAFPQRRWASALRLQKERRPGCCQTMMQSCAVPTRS